MKNDVADIVGAIALGMTIAFLSLIGFFLQAPRGECRCDKPKEYHSRCSGCGAKWFHETPMADVATCPLCPLSEAEFEQLKQELRDKQAFASELYKLDGVVRASEGDMP